MVENQGRRQFLQASLAVGAAMTAAGGNPTQGIVPDPEVDSNPRIRPGRVRWHDDFAAARTASQASGKPVFLFQMLGRLDQKFC